MPFLSCLESVDGLRLAEAVERLAGELRLTVDALLEVKVSDDPAKHGVTPRDASAVLDAIQRNGPRLRIRGLMTMASRTAGPDATRREFASLRELRDSLASQHPQVTELSMGMSGDYEQAIEEGATIVRVGSALWDGVGRAEGP